jgi:hypothetical protein
VNLAPPAGVFRELETDCYQLKILETAGPCRVNLAGYRDSPRILSLTGRPGGGRFTNTTAGAPNSHRTLQFMYKFIIFFQNLKILIFSLTVSVLVKYIYLETDNTN